MNPARFKLTDLVPKVSMKDPFAARRRCPGRGRRDVEQAGKKDKGITEMSAPVSTKKENSDSLSNTDMEP